MAALRIIKHLFTSPRRVYSYFSADALSRITSKIAESELRHGGELRVVVEAALEWQDLIQGKTAHDRAIELFSHHLVWDTERNSGVLLYVLLADREFEILADRGVSKVIGKDRWHDIAHQVEGFFREGKYEEGVTKAIDEITLDLVTHFPPLEGDVNDLPNAPILG